MQPDKKWINPKISMGWLSDAYITNNETLVKRKVVNRIWNKDYSLWSPNPEEIANRLDWLVSPHFYFKKISELNTFKKVLIHEGINHFVLLGMGGSSLAPELLNQVFNNHGNHFSGEILDTTAPGQILEIQTRINPRKTIFIVSTKSGTTEETISLFRFFYNWIERKTAIGNAGSHFVVITDPGSTLIDNSKQIKFRKLFINNPNIGGRFSVYSYFGLLPACLSGVNLELLFENCFTMMEKCQVESESSDNPALNLGNFLGTCALGGKNKMTIFLPQIIASFSDWLEQLLAESTGKAGKGILPIVHEPEIPVDLFGNDRSFVNISLGEPTQVEQDRLSELKRLGHPVIEIKLSNVYELGGQFFLWEMATAICGLIMMIQSFNQPDVELTKSATRKIVDEFKKTGTIPSPKNSFETINWSINSDDYISKQDIFSALKIFIEDALHKNGDGSYISIQAFVKPDPELYVHFKGLQSALLQKYLVPVTFGYGPRYLHSTGQLHKGDHGKGIFIQITENIKVDVKIPDEVGISSSSISFGKLLIAQALGDQKALEKKGGQLSNSTIRQIPYIRILINYHGPSMGFNMLRLLTVLIVLDRLITRTS